MTRYVVFAVLLGCLACNGYEAGKLTAGGSVTSTTGNGCSPSSVTVTPSSGTVSVGRTIILSSAVAGPGCSAVSATWRSNNPQVATVASDGTVTGVAAGTATISAEYTSLSGTAQVTVQGGAR